MSIKVVCPGCKSTFNVAEKWLGRRANCPKCSNAFTISKAQPGREAKQTATRQKQGQPAQRQKTKAASQESEAAQAAQVTMERLLAAFQGPIKPVRPTLLYRLGILASFVTMLILPILYLALVAAVGYAVYYHATHHMVLFQSVRGRAAAYAFILYLAPLIAGPIILLFMIKPLFARPAIYYSSRSLNREYEPILFAFVDKICETVRAPKPRRIDVDCQVNASASFRKGLWSMLGSDLVLTIGMPLVAGLTAREFGGVLAHEFGHFSQGLGMRLTYVVRSITHWFIRVVYERDSWDEWLAASAASVDIRIGWILWLAILAVWLTRGLLWALLHLGMLVAGFTLRQMEFDADRYEARFAGSDAFASTAKKLRELGAGMEMANGQLGSSHQEGRLVDDLPTLVKLNSSRIPGHVRELIDHELEKKETGWFDSHPCDKDRIFNAQREQAAGVLTLDAPATKLFHDFNAQAKATTWEFYRGIFGNNLKKSVLQPVKELVASHDQQTEGYKKLSRYTQGAIRAYRRIPLQSGFLTKPEAPKEVAEQLKAARAAIVSGADTAREVLAKYDEYNRKLAEAAAVEAYHNAGLQIDKKAFDPSLHTRKGCRGVQEKMHRSIRAIEDQVAEFDKNLAARLRLALELLQLKQVADRVDQRGEFRARVDALLPVLVAIDGQLATTNKMADSQVMLTALMHQVTSNPDERLVGALERIADKVQPQMAQVREVLSHTPYPFDTRTSSESVGGFVLPNPPTRRDLGMIVQGLPEMTDRLISVRMRTFAELSSIAERVEAALGLPPLPEPPEPEEADSE